MSENKTAESRLPIFKKMVNPDNNKNSPFLNSFLPNEARHFYSFFQ
jgi:hypothetical protein